MRMLAGFAVAAFLSLAGFVVAQDVFFDDDHSQNTEQQNVEKEPFTCPVCGRKMDPAWRFCPYDGTELAKPERPPVRSPKEVLWCFFKGFRDGDKKLMAESLALDVILEGFFRTGIENSGDIPASLRALCAAKLPGPPARAAVPAMLDILASEEARALQVFLDDITIDAFSLLYKVKRSGPDTAEIWPTAESPDATNTIRLRKIDGIWRIVSFPRVAR